MGNPVRVTLLSGAVLALSLAATAGFGHYPTDDERTSSETTSTSNPAPTTPVTGQSDTTSPPSTTVTSTTVPDRVPLGPGRYASAPLAFEDDFTGTELDGTRWTTCYWWHQHWWLDTGCTNEGTGEVQWYAPENVSVSDGRLALTAEREIVRLRTDGERFDFTSGMVTTGRDSADTSTPPRFAFTYGHVEARARVPAGDGLFPALWLLPVSHDSLPEIDIFEFIGDSTYVDRMHFHWSDLVGQRQSEGHSLLGPDFSTDWHVFGLDWSPEEIVWLVDGEVAWRFAESSAIPSEPMYLIANLAVGGDFAGPPTERTKLPASLELDYIRVWTDSPHGQ